MLIVQLEQFNMNMMENLGDSSHCSTLNYTQAAMMGLTGSHSSQQEAQQLSYSSHGNIPNIILTGIVSFNSTRMSLCKCLLKRCHRGTINALRLFTYTVQAQVLGRTECFHKVIIKSLFTTHFTLFCKFLRKTGY